MPKINARVKGQKGERDACKFLEEFGWTANRNWQAAGAKERPDLHTDFPAHLEIKNVEKLNIWAAMEQAMRDAKPGTEPIVMFKRNRSKWLVALDAKSFFSYMGELLDKRKSK